MARRYLNSSLKSDLRLAFAGSNGYAHCSLQPARFLNPVDHGAAAETVFIQNNFIYFRYLFIFYSLIRINTKNPAY